MRRTQRDMVGPVEQEHRTTGDRTTGNSRSMTAMERAQNAIDKLARRRKKRKPKFVLNMTRVEEERSHILTSFTEDPRSVISSNDYLSSNGNGEKT